MRWGEEQQQENDCCYPTTPHLLAMALNKLPTSWSTRTPHQQPWADNVYFPGWLRKIKENLNEKDTWSMEASGIRYQVWSLLLLLHHSCVTLSMWQALGASVFSSVKCDWPFLRHRAAEKIGMPLAHSKYSASEATPLLVFPPQLPHRTFPALTGKATDSECSEQMRRETEAQAQIGDEESPVPSVQSSTLASAPGGEHPHPCL